MDFFQAEREVDGVNQNKIKLVSLSTLNLYFRLNPCFLLLLIFINEYFKCYKIDSNKQKVVISKKN